MAKKKEEKIVNTLKIHDHDLFLFLAKPKNNGQIYTRETIGIEMSISIIISSNP